MQCLLKILLNRLNPEAARLFNEGQVIGSFNAINWTSGTVQDLENIVLTGPKQTYCSSSSSEVPYV